jgi:hypothetical protein
MITPTRERGPGDTTQSSNSRFHDFGFRWRLFSRILLGSEKIARCPSRGESAVTLADVDVVPPPFFCPIPAAVHAAVGQVDEMAVRWLERIGLHRSEREWARLLGTNSAEFYARFAPDATPAGLLTAVMWVYWGFAFDDAWCDSGPISADPPAFLALAGQVQRALETAEPPADPYAAALHEIAGRMRAQVTPTVFRRFAEAHRYWLSGVAWQIGNCAAKRVPAMNEYLTMRIGSAGGPPTIALLEVANGIEVPPREMDSPAVRALTDMTHLIAALDNDLHSYGKELAESPTCQNIVSVLRHHDGLGVTAALDAAVAIRDRAMLRFLELRDRVRTGASAPLRTFLDCLGHGIRGNLDWAAGVPRYLTGGPLRVEITDEPCATDPGPLPYPTVSWWWDRLIG